MGVGEKKWAAKDHQNEKRAMKGFICLCTGLGGIAWVTLSIPYGNRILDYNLF